MNTSYTSLEPSAASPFGINNSSLSFNPGQPVSFYASSFFVYTILFVAIVAAAFYRYIRAALWRVQASQTSIGKSNEAFRTATLGLLGAFSLFLILYTFNKDLLVGDVGLGALKAEKFAGGGGTFSGAGSTVDGPTPTPAPVIINGTGAQNLKALNDIGITINHNNIPCTQSQLQQSNPPCTSLEGLPDTSLNMLSQLRSSCTGNIVVTGGTEPGHSSHGPGRTPVDIAIDDGALNACIRRFSQSTPLSWCNATFTNFGYVFCDEINRAPHWHVFK